MQEILKLKKFLNYRGFEFQDIDKAFSKLNKENL
jgi:SOS response regulatory protein OraA/RecX